MKFDLIYITSKDKEEAVKIGKILLEGRLVSCINIFNDINSMYWWEGEIKDDNEVVIIAKTKESLVPKVIEKVKSVHSYSCPCIVAVPINSGNEEFLNWISTETK